MAPRGGVRLGPFELLGRVGAGGMGVVWRARHDLHGDVVALKQLRHTTPLSLIRFKNEFRALAEVVHPNLVLLHQLACHADTWFYTMDFVAGRPFASWVRLGPGDSEPDAQWESETGELPAPTGGLGPFPADCAAARARRVDRVRRVIPQLVAGVAALHDRGVIHCDIKPSNVLVTSDDRVVILDFGVVRALHGPALPGTWGTPPFTAPEVLAGAAPSAASDWYAVGVMLHLALHGTDPAGAGAPPTALPPRLQQACQALLGSDPATRGDGNRLLDALGERRRRAAAAGTAPAMVGRAGVLEQLRAIHERVIEGRAAGIVTVVGPAGIGKSTTVGSYLNRSDKVSSQSRRAPPDTIVLRGRCFVRESVRFNAIDGVIDDLVTVVGSVDPAEAGRCHALARLFPVAGALCPAPAVDEGRTGAPGTDGIGLVAELLGRLARSRPVVVWLDDLQWADADSVRLLEALFALSGAPPVLLIVSHRPLEAGQERVCDALELLTRALPFSRQVVLGPLESEAVAALVRQGLGRAAATHGHLVSGIVASAQGSPLIAHSLARSAAALRAAQPGVVSWPGFVRDRLARLPNPARTLVEAVAVAGRPTETAIALAVSGPVTGRQLARLHTERWLHRDGNGDLSLDHDRVREEVDATLSEPQRRLLHARLAEAVAAAPDPDPDRLVGHWLGAGLRERARAHAVDAAANAESRDAFARAAELWGLAAEGCAPGGADWRRRLTRQAETALWAGQLQVAGHLFRTLSESTPGDAGRQHRLMAAKLLIQGEASYDEGVALMREVLGELGVPMPRSRFGAITRLLLIRTVLALRGLRPHPPGKVVEPRRLARIDAARDAMEAFGMSRAPLEITMAVAGWMVLQALRTGEPTRAAFALDITILTKTFAGEVDPLATASCRQWANALVPDRDRVAPSDFAWGCHVDALAALGRDELENALALAQKTEALLLPRPREALERSAPPRFMILHTLELLGRLHTHRPLAERYLVLMDRTGLARLREMFACYVAVASLLIGDRHAAAELAARVSDWPPYPGVLQLPFATFTRGLLACHRDDAAAATALLNSAWGASGGTHPMRHLRVHFQSHLVRLLLCALPREPARAKRRLLRLARRLDRWGTPCARGWAALARSGAAAHERSRADAVRWLDGGADHFARAGMPLHAATLRYRAAALAVDREQRRQSLADALATVANAEVLEQAARLYAPGMAGLT